mmetsp:Transcript_10820/g.36721  ORF Transcript_10820/g.36721 Transcript_10820/m.36721 type:complete len:215 (+) Transcript_10820:134-778(+)
MALSRRSMAFSLGPRNQPASPTKSTKRCPARVDKGCGHCAGSREAISSTTTSIFAGLLLWRACSNSNLQLSPCFPEATLFLYRSVTKATKMAESSIPLDILSTKWPSNPSSSNHGRRPRAMSAVLIMATRRWLPWSKPQSWLKKTSYLCCKGLSSLLDTMTGAPAVALTALTLTVTHPRKIDARERGHITNAMAQSMKSPAAMEKGTYQGTTPV